MTEQTAVARPSPKGGANPIFASLDDWIQQEAIPFAVASPDSFRAAVDKLIASLEGPVELLGLGEALHGGADILQLRNRLFERLAEAHGFCAIAIESSFPRARAVDEYVAGRGSPAYDQLRDTGFSHGFGRLDANRELVEWMRARNADPSRSVKLRFYGFDSPTEMSAADSPRQVLDYALDCLAAIDHASSDERRARIERLLGKDAAWEEPAAMMDPARSIGLSADAAAVRLETEDLIAELRVRRPEFTAKSGAAGYAEAMHYATLARQLLNYHAAMARASPARVAALLGMRAAIMADNLSYIVSRERGRGRVLAFAHNTHLRRGSAQWQLGAEPVVWWTAGAHLNDAFGRNYAVIGTAVGVSEANGIGQPEAGVLEERLTAAPGPGRFIPTHRSEGLPATAVADLPTRKGSAKNLSYSPLTPQSLRDFDWLAVLNTTT